MGDANTTSSIADYLAQLLKDKKQLAAFPSVFLHVERLLDEGKNRDLGAAGVLGGAARCEGHVVGAGDVWCGLLWGWWCAGRGRGKVVILPQLYQPPSQHCCPGAQAAPGHGAGLWWRGGLPHPRRLKIVQHCGG